ncbi:hypothetical protein GCM10028793_35570 [Nocardiopsis oceani]
MSGPWVGFSLCLGPPEVGRWAPCVVNYIRVTGRFGGGRPRVRQAAYAQQNGVIPLPGTVVREVDRPSRGRRPARRGAGTH